MGEGTAMLALLGMILPYHTVLPLGKLSVSVYFVAMVKYLRPSNLESIEDEKFRKLGNIGAWS